MLRKDINLYDHGLPFSEAIAKNIDGCLALIDNNKASLIIIDGQMGEGKTTLAIQIAQYVEKRYKGNLKDNFYNPFYVDFNKQLGMGGEAFQEKLQLSKDSGFKTVIYDEAGDFSRTGAITAFNRQLARVFQTFRTYKILIILVLPCFRVLDNNLFLQGVPKLLLNCHRRNKKYGQIRGYGYEKMLWLRYKLEKEVIIQNAYKKISTKLRGQFLDLPKEISIKLDKVSTEYKSDYLSGNVLKNQGLLTKKTIAKELGRSFDWTNKKLHELNIKPSQVHKRVNYYDNSILLDLAEHKKEKGRPKK